MDLKDYPNKQIKSLMKLIKKLKKSIQNKEK